MSSSAVSNSEASWANSSSSVGQLLLLHLGDLDLHLDVLADEVAADQLRGEGLVVAGAHADQGLVEALEHAAAAHAVGHAADLGALDRLAVLGGDQVDGHEVAVGRRALDVAQGAEPLTQRLDLVVDVVVGDRGVVDLGAQAVPVGNGDLGADVDLGGELDRLVVVDPGDLDLGLGQGLEVVRLQRLDVLLRDDLVDRLLEHGTAPDLAVDHRRGHLAAPEAGHVDLLGDGPCRPCRGSA